MNEKARCEMCESIVPHWIVWFFRFFDILGAYWARSTDGQVRQHSLDHAMEQEAFRSARRLAACHWVRNLLCLDLFTHTFSGNRLARTSNQTHFKCSPNSRLVSCVSMLYYFALVQDFAPLFSVLVFFVVFWLKYRAFIVLVDIYKLQILIVWA